MARSPSSPARAAASGAASPAAGPRWADVALVDVRPTGSKRSPTRSPKSAQRQRHSSLTSATGSRSSPPSTMPRRARRLRHHGQQCRYRAGRPDREVTRGARPDLGDQRRRRAVGYPGRGREVQGTRAAARSAIINASSIAGHEGFAMLGPYSATKFAVARSPRPPPRSTPPTASPSTPTAPVWSAPTCGSRSTSGSPNSPAPRRARRSEKFVGDHRAGPAETPDDVAGFVAYLAGPDADYMTGQAGFIDGGMVYR